MKDTGAKRNVCPGSCVSTGAKFPVAPVESAPMATSPMYAENAKHYLHMLLRPQAAIPCHAAAAPLCSMDRHLLPAGLTAAKLPHAAASGEWVRRTVS